MANQGPVIFDPLLIFWIWGMVTNEDGGLVENGWNLVIGMRPLLEGDEHFLGKVHAIFMKYIESIMIIEIFDWFTETRQRNLVRERNLVRKRN